MKSLVKKSHRILCSSKELSFCQGQVPGLVHCLHFLHDRYAKNHGWNLDDISLSSSGNIAVSGHCPYKTYVCIYGSTVDNSDSRERPTLLYHKQFPDKGDWWPRCISFIKPNPTEIVTCWYDEVQVIDYNRDVGLQSHKVNGWTTCLSVSESQIFIGLWMSDIVNIYDHDLNRIKSIVLKGISNSWPWDIAAADRLYVCTTGGYRYGRAIIYSRDSGSVLTEYTTGQDLSKARSIAVNIQHQIVAVLWNPKRVAVYSLNSNNCLIFFDVESGVSKIRISDQGRIVTGDDGRGEVKIHDLGDLALDNLSAKLAQFMSSDEIKKFRKRFNILDKKKDESSEYSLETLKKNVKEVLTILKERGILYPNKANELKTFFNNLGCLATSNLSGPIHLYQKFSKIYGDMPQHDQPTVNAGRLNDSFSVSPSHEIPKGRFPKQHKWHNLNLINVVNTSHGLVCYTSSEEIWEPNVSTQLFKLPSLDSSDNPQKIYSKVISKQGYDKLFLTFIDETHLVMCYNETLEIIDIKSKKVARGHRLPAAAKTMDVEEGEIFVVVGNSSAVLVFNQNLEEIAKLTFTLEDWQYPADIKVTSERLFIICKVKPRDHDRSYNWQERAMSFRREDGDMEANYTFPGEQYTKPISIAAHKESEFVGVLWSMQSLWSPSSETSCMVSLHTLSGCCVFLLDVKNSQTIQILNKNTMIVINQFDGLKFYNMAHFFTFSILPIRLSSFITLPECTGLQNFYGISDDEVNRKDSGSSQFGNLTSIRRRFLHLFKILEEKGLVGPSKLDDFIVADSKVRATLPWSHVEAYWKLLAETGIMKRASLEAGPSVQVHVSVTQEGGVENLVNVSCQEGTSAQSLLPYPVTGGSHPHPTGPSSLESRPQHHQQLQPQAKQHGQQHDQAHAAAFQQEQVTQQQSTVALGQQAQQHLDQQAISRKGSYTSRKTIITKVGGTVEISNTGIFLVIPPNALPADKEEHEIYMRYIPRRAVEDPVKCFSSNSTAVAEILPNLRLRHPVRLSLPHCLVLQQNLERKAKIFASRHEKGTRPFWEEQKDVSYHVEDTTCIVLLNSFSWYKYCIDNEIVIAKKIVVYAAAQEIKPHDDVVRIEVGCYPDLPGQDERNLCDYDVVCVYFSGCETEDLNNGFLGPLKDIAGGQNLLVAHKKILYFVKSEKQHPLQISLNDILPSGWQCRRSSKLKDTFSKKILYSKISEDLGDSCIFILEKLSDAADMPLCVFTASQEKDVEMDNLAVQLAVNFQVIDKVPPTAGVTGHQCKSLLRAETTITRSGVKLEIPDTGVVLSIPPNAVEGNGENHLVGMRIIPGRIIEDQETSLSSNSCTAVEVYPHTLSLRQSIKLRLPHCLTFNENSNLSARIFTMYLKESTPKWKLDTNPQYQLDEKACLIKLNKLCCVQYFIDDNIVKGKKIRAYTAAKKLKRTDGVAELEVGFCSDIPGGGELLRMNPNFTVDSKKKFLFMGKQRCPLQLSLDDIAPSLWECWFPKDKPQDIPVKAIAASIEHSNLFILKKTSNKVGSAICTFTTLPKEGPMSLEMALTVCPQEPHSSQSADPWIQSHDDAMNRTIRYLSRKLGSEWQSVGRELGLQEEDLYRIKTDNRTTYEAINGMLVCWKQRKGSEATYLALIKSLEMAGRKDLAEKVQSREDLLEA